MERELFDEMAALALEHGDGARRASPTRWRCWMSRLALANSRSPRAMCGPKIDNGLGFRIARGRHPVVEAALAGRQCGPLRAQ